MEILHPTQRFKLLEYIKELKDQLSDWLIAEVKYVHPSNDKLSVETIAELLGTLFSQYEGLILVCNQAEILILIKWRKENSPHLLAKEIGKHLPDSICEVNILPVTKEGLQKIELLILPAPADAALFYKARVARRENVFMIVDDDKYLRLLVRKGLEDLGTVIEVEDATKVVEVYKIYNPDLILLDIHIPQLTGQDLLHLLKKTDPTAYAVMISADSSIDNVQLAKQHGAKGFLTKPFNKNRLMEYVNACPTVA